MRKKDILILIPHGGYQIPHELKNYSVLDKHELFLEADSGAREIFSFSSKRIICLQAEVSRLFIDLDRPYTALNSSSDPVIKKKTSRNRDIFLPDHFPDEIALTNILKRHYFPFHDTIEKILNTEEVKLIIDCHTISPSDPATGEPRPLFLLQNKIGSEESRVNTAPDDLAEFFIDTLRKKFSKEKETVAERFSLNSPFFESFIMKKYYKMGIPLFRLSLSKALFLNERHFSFDYLKLDEIRIKSIQEKLLQSIEILAKQLS